MALAHDWPLPAHDRLPVCRRTDCPQAARSDGLCDEHAARQLALRQAARALPPKTNPTAQSASLAVLLAAVNLDGAAWRTRAACRGMTGTMTPGSAGGRRPANYTPALAICAGCPVVGPCRVAGTAERFGVWGGTTPRERKVAEDRAVQAQRQPNHSIASPVANGPARASEAI